MDERALKELDYGITLSVQTIVEALGMFSENLHRLSLDKSIAYGDEEFQALIERNGVHHNGCLERWIRVLS